MAKIIDYNFSIFYGEIECYAIDSPSIKYIAYRPEFIKATNDIYSNFHNIKCDRKNGLIHIYNNNAVMIEFKASNLIDAINSNKSYYAFDYTDVELIFSKEEATLEAIVYANQTISHYSAEIKDKEFSIISFDSVSVPNDDEIILNSQRTFSIKLFKVPREISVEFQKEIIDEMNKELTKSAIGKESNICAESDIEQIAIMSVNNNWASIFIACMETETLPKSTKDKCLRIAVKNGNLEIARLCL